MTGTQKQVALPQLLYALHKRSFSGSLKLSPSAGEAVHICFKDGFPVGTDVSSAEDALGRVLLEHGWITEESFTSSLEEVAKRPAKQMSDVWRLQGDVLVEQGAITSARLKEGRQLRLRRQLNRLFFLRELAFQALEGEYPKNGDWSADDKVDPLQVIHHGVCNAYDEQQLETALQQLEGITLHTAPGFAERLKRYDLEKDKQALAEDLTQSSWSLQEAVTRSELDPLQTRMLVYVLWITEALHADGAREEEPQRAAAPLEVKAEQSGEESNGESSKVSGAPEELTDLLAQYVEAEETQRASATEPTRPPSSAADEKDDEEDDDDEVGPLEQIELPPLSQGTRSAAPPAPPGEGDTIPAATPAAAPGGGTPPNGSPELLTVTTLDEGGSSQPQRRRRISTELDLNALGNLKSNISSILTSVEKIATGEYEAIDPVKLQEHKTGRPRRVTGPHLPALDPAQSGETAQETAPETAQETAQKEEAPSAPKPDSRPVREIPLIEQGISAFRDEEYATAQERFIAAAKQAPGDGRPLAWLAWTRHRAPEIDPHKEPVRNKQLLLRAIQLTPSCPDCHYFLGEIYLALGDKGRAGTCFFRAVELKPEHAQAKRRLQRIQQEQKKDSGLFGRLFKK